MVWVQGGGHPASSPPSPVLGAFDDRNLARSGALSYGPPALGGGQAPPKDILRTRAQGRFLTPSHPTPDAVRFETPLARDTPYTPRTGSSVATVTGTLSFGDTFSAPSASGVRGRTASRLRGRTASRLRFTRSSGCPACARQGAHERTIWDSARSFVQKEIRTGTQLGLLDRACPAVWRCRPQRRFHQHCNEPVYYRRRTRSARGGIDEQGSRCVSKP